MHERVSNYVYRFNEWRNLMRTLSNVQRNGITRLSAQCSDLAVVRL